MTTRITGGSVRDRCLKIMSHLTQAEVMGTKLEHKSKVDIILESLLDHYTQFKVNCNINKLDLISTELIHELESVERDFKKQVGAHIAESSSVKLKGKPKGGNKNKKNIQVPVSKTTAMKNPKGKCFKCGQKGY